MKMRSLTIWSLAFAVVGACGDSAGPKGRVQVFVTAEDTIPDGLTPGTGDENIQDGWTVTYQKYLITIGNFRASRSTQPADSLSEPKIYVLDMKNLPAGGFLLAQFDGAAAQRWDKVGYDMPNASAATACATGVTAFDCNLMKTSRYSLYIEGTMTKPDGRSCRPDAPADCVNRTSLTFKWGFNAGTAFDDCAPPSGDAGFAVPTGGVASVKPTIHGDHWFFTSFVHEEAKRRAQWIADADLDRDGATSLDEIRRVQASNVFPAGVYNLSGGGIIATAYDYVVAQVRSLGDFQGDGECPTRTPLP